MIFQAHIDTVPNQSNEPWCAHAHFGNHYFTCIAPTFDKTIQTLSNMMARQFSPDLENTGFTHIDLGPGRVEIYVPALTTPFANLQDCL